jgi:predicted metal-binding membrane protein
MMSQSGLSATRERAATIGALLLVAGFAWVYTFYGAFNAAGSDGMQMPMRIEWSTSHALSMFAMWWVMMTAMMLPSASPTILLYAALKKGNSTPTFNTGSTAAFTTGYLCIWAFFSLVAVGLQWLLQEAGLLSDSLSLTNPAGAAGLLMGAGLYQFSSVKTACLSQCRSPAAALQRIWRPGSGGAFMMGLHHGLYCLGCCWFLMLLLFFGGIMSPLWIAALAIYIAIEKLTPFGTIFGKAVGCVLILVGFAWALLP